MHDVLQDVRPHKPRSHACGCARAHGCVHTALSVVSSSTHASQRPQTYCSAHAAAGSGSLQETRAAICFVWRSYLRHAVNWNKSCAALILHQFVCVPIVADQDAGGVGLQRLSNASGPHLLGLGGHRCVGGG